MIKNLLKSNRQKINEELVTAEARQYFSPSVYGDFRVTKSILEKYVTGKLIDVGCGTMPYKFLIEPKVSQYDTFDVEQRVQGVKFIGDIQHMFMIPDQSYDSAICLEVLEHVSDPFKALSEISRILKSSGILILSVPHLSRLHEEPHDYFRYTKYGLKSILERNHFEVITIQSRGGLFSFLGHQFSSAFVCLFWHIPVLKQLAFFLNKWFCTKLCYFLDGLIGKEIFAEGYTVVARKR